MLIPYPLTHRIRDSPISVFLLYCLNIFLSTTIQKVIFAFFSKLSIFGFIIQSAMAISFEIRIGNLFSEFFSNALVFFYHLKAARTVPSPFFQSFFNRCYDFFIFIESYHKFSLTPLYNYNNGLKPVSQLPIRYNYIHQDSKNTFSKRCLCCVF